MLVYIHVRTYEYLYMPPISEYFLPHEGQPLTAPGMQQCRLLAPEASI